MYIMRSYFYGQTIHYVAKYAILNLILLSVMLLAIHLSITLIGFVYLEGKV